MRDTTGGSGPAQARRLQSEDAELAFEAIRSIKQPASHPTFGVDYFRKFLARPENVLIVASDESGPSGFLLAYRLNRVDRDQPMFCLYEIGVAEAHRRRGVGQTMIDVLKRLCEQLDAAKMWTITDRSNEAAARLYESTGASVQTSAGEALFVWGAESWGS